MTILLYNDGRLVIDDGNPIEGNSLEGLVACVSDPQSGDTLKFDGKQWVAGAAASGLPDVSGDDDGKVLTVVDGAWAPAAGGGGGSFSPDITDPQDGQTLVYDATAGKWVNGAGGGVFVIRDAENTTHLDKTWQEIRDALAAGQLCVMPYGFNEETQSQDNMEFVFLAQRDNGNYYIRTYSMDYTADPGSSPVILRSYVTDEGPNGYPGWSN